MCHASSGDWYCRANRRNCLAACLAQERADRCRQTFPNEISSSKGNKTTDTKAASGKASPYESGPRTTAIMDGKIVFRSCHPCQQTPWWQLFYIGVVLCGTLCISVFQ
jgi:hypothetical protein